jgi:hypothetical protein
MAREPVGVKATRYLADRRVRVLELVAVVEGDTGSWRAVLGEDGWSCSCPARGHCSHAETVDLLVDPEPRRPAPPVPVGGAA